MKGHVQFKNTKKEFKRFKNAKRNVNTNGFKTEKKGARYLLSELHKDSVMMFSDGSVLGNSGPEGTGDIILDGYQASPVLQKKGVSLSGNIFTDIKDNLPAAHTWWRNLPPLHVITNEVRVSQIQLITQMSRYIK